MNANMQFEVLSVAIIEILKKMSSSGKAITPRMLQEALSRNADLFAQFPGRNLSVPDPLSGLKAKSLEGQSQGSLSGAEQMGPGTGGVPPSEALLRRTKEFCLGVLDAFNEVPEQEGSQTASEVQNTLLSCESVGDVLDLGEEIIRTVRSLTKRYSEEVSLLRGVLTEMSQTLEESTFSSLKKTHERHKANESFSVQIEKQVVEISGEVQNSETVMELKSSITSKLGFVKSQLKEKRDHDRQEVVKTTAEVKELRKRIERMKSEIDKAREEVKSLECEAVLDPLTGAHNRRAYERRLEESLGSGENFALFLIDVDHFKEINDTHGHYAGDKCLRVLTEKMSSCLRKSDFIARYGGDEFAVIAPIAMESGVAILAKRLLDAVQKTRFQYRDREFLVHISIGATWVSQPAASTEEVFNRADKALYEAKEKGRNCHVVN
jgi:diguanylate cyclase